MTAGASIGGLPHALRDGDELTRHFRGRRPAVFLVSPPPPPPRTRASSCARSASTPYAEVNGPESEQVTPGMTLLEFFDVDISGRDFAQGKPNPEIFFTAAHELGVPPAECFVVEDAVSGIPAAKAGGMAALGLSRAHDEDLVAAA